MAKNIGIIFQGGQVLKPSVLPTINTSALIPSTPGAAPPPLMIGVSDGGDPTKIYTFNGFEEAEQVLRGGQILSYIARVFNPSADQVNAPGAPSIKFIRASSAAQRGSIQMGSVFTDGAWTNVNITPTLLFPGWG